MTDFFSKDLSLVHLPGDFIEDWLKGSVLFCLTLMLKPSRGHLWKIFSGKCFRLPCPKQKITAGKTSNGILKYDRRKGWGMMLGEEVP